MKLRSTRIAAALLAAALLAATLAAPAAARPLKGTGTSLQSTVRRLLQGPGCSTGATPTDPTDPCFNGITNGIDGPLPNVIPLPSPLNVPPPANNPPPGPTCSTISGHYVKGLFGQVKPAPCLFFCWAWPTVQVCQCGSSLTWGACKA